MTIRERIISVYRGQIPDKPPLAYIPVIFDQETSRDAPEPGAWHPGLLPPVSLLAPPWHIQPGYVSEVRNAILDVKISWKDGQMVETRTLETSKGNISQITAKDPSSGSDWILKPYLERPEDLRVMSHLAEETIFRDQTPAFRQRTTDLGEDGVVLARLDRSPYQKLLIELVDPQRFLIHFSLDPDPYEELMEVMGRRLDEQFELALASDAEILWQPDITSDMTPPRFFETTACHSMPRGGGLPRGREDLRGSYGRQNSGAEGSDRRLPHRCDRVLLPSRYRRRPSHT